MGAPVECCVEPQRQEAGNSGHEDPLVLCPGGAGSLEPARWWKGEVRGVTVTLFFAVAEPALLLRVGYKRLVGTGDRPPSSED